MIDSEKIPVHVSFIMDGNGRWAKQQGKDRFQGHIAGVESVRACVKTAVELGVRYMSVFAFSEENWGRPESEVLNLMELMGRAMLAEMPSLNKNGVRFRVLGNRERLSKGLRSEIEQCESMTASNTALDLIVFLSYSGKWDIAQAARQMALEVLEKAESLEEAREQMKACNIDTLNRYMITAGIPDPDLIIRTSGEMRVSNYLLWQGAYSEYLFVDTLWPDFRREEFIQALETYAKRDRRWGKIK
ncbi:MAG: di-trans,poly-cis-decaprenylcistransferase [Bacteroidales bacterium]|nr:di-trans,poly-cis-decaprenylcistransferase [Bacteroidales bacterium]MBQ1937768.1 di-trans,poly-cis-decaprenylcistransferase [Bacteroidales bacterium]